MERLTIPDIRIDEHTTRRTIIDGNAVREDAMEFYWRLKKIEDLLGDEYDLDHLRKLVQAEKDGRLVVPPCKVGDTVYIPDYAKIAIPVRVQGISITVSGRTILRFGGYPVESAWGDEVGKTVFLTREEAEAALKGGAE